MSQDLYSEKFRPQFHYSPLQKWLNDPNGMVYYEGEYHLFYQYHPYSTVWGPMHWGHAVSEDLVHWRELPIALFPDRHGTIFSGSAVVDWNNTSGLGSKSTSPMVAIFTYHNQLRADLGYDDYQAQGIAYSLDNGRSWTVYEGNPVLPNQGDKDFRDPKVFWYEHQKKWVMVLAVNNRISFFSSENLKQWQFESSFGEGWGSHGGVWECPDIFEIPVEGEKSTRYVLLVSVISGAPNGGTGTQYFVGDFDGSRFTVDQSLDYLNAAPNSHASGSRITALDKKDALWLDYGSDNYAGVTWSNIPADDGRRIFLGWMSNWNYAQDTPTDRWRGAMTLPRELTLHKTEAGYLLKSIPIIELHQLRGHGTTLRDTFISEEKDLTRILNLDSAAVEYEFRLDMKNANLMSLSFSNELEQRVVFTVDRTNGVYRLDRTGSGEVNFNDDFASIQSAPIISRDNFVSIRLFLDASSIEIFVNNGETTMTALVFPAKPYSRLALKTVGLINLESLTVYELKSIWGARL